MTPRLPHHAGFTRQQRGMTLVEVAISTVVVGVMLCAALTTVGSSATARRVIADRTRGAMLADGLVTEIAGKAYREPTTSPILFGPESGESTGGNRSEFDDVDDFHNWSGSPPSRADGTPVPGFTGWTRNAVVEWVQPAALNTTSATDQGVKRIRVNALCGSRKTATLTTLRIRRNTPPNAVAAVESGSTAHGQVWVPVNGYVQCSAADSTDADADTLTCLWSFGDGRIATGTTISHQYTQAGEVHVKLSVYDGKGGVDQDVCRVLVGE